MKLPGQVFEAGCDPCPAEVQPRAMERGAPVPAKRVRLSLLAGAFLLILMACNGGSPTDPQRTAQLLPQRFSMTGSASSVEDDGTSVSCILELYFELEESPSRSEGVLEYAAVLGGYLNRTVLDAEGNGISLGPDVYGSAIVRSIAPNTVEIEVPVNAGTGSRFWEELSLFEGTIASDGTASGLWNCAPFDIGEGGYADTLYTASGPWTIVPVG